MEESQKKIEENANKIEQMAFSIIGDNTLELDNYLERVRACFLKENEILDQDLDKIVLQIPCYLYHLIVFAQQLEMRKGLAKEQASYSKNEVLLTATGTVQQKEAYSEVQTTGDRLLQLAYTTASQIITNKINGAMSILDSTKKVQQKRLKEKALTNMAGNAVGAF